MSGLRPILWLSVLAFALSGCVRPQSTESESPEGKLRLVFKHQPLWGNPAAFKALLDRFRTANPDVELVTELLPNSSDVTHQYFLTALEGGSQDFDVLITDVVWVTEFARAGWIADLSETFPPEQVRKDYFPGAAEAVLLDGRTYAIPWYVDVGLLFYRSDLIPSQPKTYDDFKRAIHAVLERNIGLQGYLWQGRQYEGLVCNAYEAIWGHGGGTLEGGHLLLDNPKARAGLSYLRSLITEGVSPPSVMSSAEEEARLVFQEGKAVAMRNWPYAWAEAQKEGSPIRGKVAVAPLPTSGGEIGSGTLGGYQLAINARSSPAKKKAAAKLIAHLTTPEANLALALGYGRNPPRPAIYRYPEVERQVPFIASLLPIVDRAKPRPVTPYYNLISDVLQGEFSAAISGVRSPEAALQRAQKLADHTMEEK